MVYYNKLDKCVLFLWDFNIIFLFYMDLGKRIFVSNKNYISSSWLVSNDKHCLWKATQDNSFLKHNILLFRICLLGGGWGSNTTEWLALQKPFFISLIL